MLYLISTPIGNLADISQRALETLQTVDIVACEDTRTSQQLFNLLGIKTNSLTPYHEHNADSARPKLIEKLKKGASIALVSDAGTPLISDPGYKLVRECKKNNIPVTTIPGANAVLSALQLSGLPTDTFLFAGFLPPKESARRQTLAKFKNVPATLIFYETAHRLSECLQDILSVLGNREIALVREITKKFEESNLTTVQKLVNYYQTNPLPKGEMVLVISREALEEENISDIDELIKKTLKKHSIRDTVQLVTGFSGLSKKEVYKKVLELAQ